ncbi:MAG TPA: HAMP domain-containing sensor histidine kinase [Myxococcaceae bacterium]|nr:HAMP domain-containing sensor histidine kinase [Myxococcaceae bacterium]
MTDGARPPRRYRRRLVAFILAAGLVPLGAWGVASEGALRGLLDISLAPLEQVMDEADAALSGKGGPEEAAKVREQLSGARLALAELELARRSLARLEPRLFWAALALTAAVFGAMAVAVSRAFTRPIDQLTAGMAAVARGELGHVIPAERGPPRDELSYLVDRFNKMAAELLAQRERLRTTEQLAAWRDVARALAHELKNPLTAMKMSLARLTRASPSPSPDADRQREPLALLDEEVSVLMRMTQAFSEFARLPAAAPQVLDVAAVAREVAALYGAVQVDAPEEARALADPDQLRRALGNLAKNAVEAAAGAEVRVEVRPEAAAVVVRVMDRGPGIGSVVEGAALLAGLSSTKAGGSGLGLPISHRIVAEHGGTLRLEPREGGGTVATVRLPRVLA